ncbi:hypothetical protein [Leifsonella bigeumensis]
MRWRSARRDATAGDAGRMPTSVPTRSVADARMTPSATPAAWHDVDMA